MAWQTIAKKDFREAMDSRWVSYLLGLVVLAYVMGGYILPMQVQGPSTADYPGYMLTATQLLVPLFGILLGYDAVVNERTSGRLALLLSLPHSRRDVVVGKLVGRGVVLAVGVVLGILVGGALVVYPYGSLEVGGFVAYLVLTLLYGLAFVGIAMAASTLTTSRQIATAASFGVFVLFAVVWSQFRLVLVLTLEWLGLADGGLPGWALFVYGAEPGMLYHRVVAGFYHAAASGATPDPDAHWYLGEWIALGLLVCWVVVPLGLGYRRFEGTDL